MAALLALIFDVDGTLADTESAHRLAFNEAFGELGLPWRWSEPEYLRLLAISGGKERLTAYLQAVDPTLRGSRELVASVEKLHAIKTRCYADRVGQGQVPLRPGVARLFAQAQQRGLPLALATTTTPANIDALLRTPLGPNWRQRFAVIGDAATAQKKKPDPQVYLQVLDQLGVSPQSCIAFEDSQNGLRAACAAAIPTIVTPTAYTVTEDFAGALRVLPDLGQLEIPELEALAALR
jgi:HAD superfamily hydrolase (TIGR01509 family)